MQRIAVSLPYPVTTNNLYVNVRNKGRVPTERYRTWKRVAETEIMAQRGKWSCKSISGPVALSIEVGMPDNRRRDLSNCIKCLEDACVSMGLIDDDSQVQRIEIEWVEDMQGARVEITPHVQAMRGAAE